MAAAAQWSLVDRVRGYVELLRPHNLLVSVITTYIGYGLVTKVVLGYPVLLPSFAWAALAVVLIAAGGYVVNDYFDREVDAVDKPWRPIPSGRVPASHAYALSLALFALGVAASLPLGPVCAAYAAGEALLLHEYSRRLKRSGLPGNVVVAFSSGSTIIYGGLAAAEPLSALPAAAWTLLPFAYAFTLSLAREIVKGVEDYRGDSMYGIKTLAVKLGPARAARVAAATLLGVAAASPLPILVGPYTPLYLPPAVVVAAMCVYDARLLTVAARSGVEAVIAAAAKARRHLKVAFAIGGVAFIAGLYP